MALPAVKSWMVARLVAYLTGGTTEAPLYVDADGNLRVTLGGTNASAGAVAQGTKTGTTTNGWLVTLYSAAGAALLGRLAAAASIPVVLSTEDKADLASLVAALPFLKPPGSQTPITVSDSTDVSTIASIGLLVTSIAGGTVLDTRGTTTTGTTVSWGPVVVGQIIYGSFSRVMASTTCTVKGLAP